MSCIIRLFNEMLFKMKGFLLIVLSTLLIHNSVNAQLDSIQHNNLTRYYLTHLPAGYNANTPHSLVIAMHGGFGSATNLQDQSLLSVKADTENFIVVYPEGVKNALGIRTWNAGWCCGYASTNNIDDVGFISALIDSLLMDYNINPDRIYATGMSNGGFMSYRLACELSNRIAAIAPVAASMSLHSCNPTRPVPVIQFHSYLDTNVPYQGGVGNGVSNHWNSPHDSVHNIWSQLNQCMISSDTLVHDSLYTFVRWHSCDCNTEVHYYITQDGGHSWPGGNATVIGDPPSTYINANDLMWDFFHMHSLNCDTTATFLSSPDPEPEIFPNPTSTVVMLKNKNYKRIMLTDVYGRLFWSQTDPGFERISIPVSDHPPGIYYIKADLKDGSQGIKKLIIISTR
jgi:polyhydroxybutyrate depolymerase